MTQATNAAAPYSRDHCNMSSQSRDGGSCVGNSTSITEMYQEWQSLGLAHEALRKVFCHADIDDAPRYDLWEELQTKITNTPASDFVEVVMKMLVGTFVQDELPDEANFVVENIIFAARKDAIRLLMKHEMFPNAESFTEAELIGLRHKNEEWVIRSASHEIAEIRDANCQTQKKKSRKPDARETASVTLAMFEKQLTPDAQEFVFKKISEIMSDREFADAEQLDSKGSEDKYLLRDYFRLNQMLAAIETLFRDFDEIGLSEEQVDRFYQMQCITSVCNENASELYERLGALDTKLRRMNRSVA